MLIFGRVLIFRVMIEMSKGSIDMKKIIASASVAAILAGALITAAPADARSRHHGRNVGVGVLAGAAALAIIAGSSRRAHAEDRYDDDERQCRRWRHRCEDGSGWACRKYDRNC